MALNRSSIVPKDAVAFETEGEASNYIWDIVYQWNTLSDTWALRYGAPILGGINAISGLVINKHYRTRMKLGKLGYLSAGIPIFVMPAVLTTLFHNYMITTDMLLMKSKCPVCYEVKSALIQTTLGFGYPMVLGPTMALMLANRYGTYRVPDLTEGPRVLINFLKKHTRSLTGTLGYMAAIQLAASSIITYFEMRNYSQLTQKIQAIERQVLAEHGESEL